MMKETKSAKTLQLETMIKAGRPPRKFTTEEAVQLYNSGKTFGEVTQILSEKYQEKIPESTIRKRLKKDGVELKKRQPKTNAERLRKFKEKRKAEK